MVTDKYEYQTSSSFFAAVVQLILTGNLVSL